MIVPFLFEYEQTHCLFGLCVLIIYFYFSTWNYIAVKQKLNNNNKCIINPGKIIQY